MLPLQSHSQGDEDIAAQSELRSCSESGSGSSSNLMLLFVFDSDGDTDPDTDPEAKGNRPGSRVSSPYRARPQVTDGEPAWDRLDVAGWTSLLLPR